MSEQAKTPATERGWLWWAAGGLVLAALLAFGLSSYILQSKAGKRIDHYVRSLESADPNPTRGIFYCLLPSMYELPESGDLDEAIAWLNTARSIAPWNVYSNFMLGQAYCLLQDYQKAGNEFEVFLARRPENLLAKAEYGFTNFAISRSLSDLQTDQNNPVNHLEALQGAGFYNNSLIKLGDSSFKQEKPQDALIWYEISNSITPLEGVRLFRYALLELVLRGETTYPDQIKEGMISTLDGELYLAPTDFFELTSGTVVQIGTEDGKPLAVLASNSQKASKLLSVVKASNYCISILAIDKPPQPTQIGIDVNFKSYKVLELGNGDKKWVQLTFPVYLDPGIHFLGVRLMNDKYIAGVLDRNVYLGSISINACVDN